MMTDVVGEDADKRRLGLLTPLQVVLDDDNEDIS